MPDCSGQNENATRPDDGATVSSPAGRVKAKSRFPDAKPDLMYDLGRRKLELQMQQVEALDNKAAGIFQAGGALLGLVGAMFAVWDVSVPDSALGPLFLGAGFFVVIILVFVLGYVTRRWGVGPNLVQAWELSDKFPEEKMYWWAAQAFKEQAIANSKRMGLKELATSWLPIIFAAEVGELLIVLIFTLASE